MNITDAAHMARRLMSDHGLGHIPFEFDGGKRRIGCTHFYTATSVKKITLSRHYAALLSEDEIRNTILHEIAHALAGHNAGHGPAWQRMAIKIGAKPTRCTTPSETLDTHAWIGKCAAGHVASKMHRAPRRIRSCSACSPTFSPEHIITWNFNGKPAALHQMPESYRTEFVKTVRF